MDSDRFDEGDETLGDFVVTKGAGHFEAAEAEYDVPGGHEMALHLGASAAFGTNVVIVDVCPSIVPRGS